MKSWGYTGAYVCLTRACKEEARQEEQESAGRNAVAAQSQMDV